MAFSMFSTQSSPIAIDFGSSSVKLLQIGTGRKPPLIAAAELAIPDSIRSDQSAVFEYYNEYLPKLVRDSGFKGRRAVCSVPCHQTHVQHMQLVPAENTKLSDMVKAQLQIQLGVMPDAVVVRPVDVGEVLRDGQSRREVICFAIARDTVMKYVELLGRCRLEVVGVHSEPLALLGSFEHLHQRDGDEDTNTLYVDIGWGGTRVAISHGTKLVFARNVQLGGRNFDQLVADHLHCDLRDARQQRLAHDVSIATQRTAAARGTRAQAGGAEAGSNASAAGASGSGSNTDARLAKDASTSATADDRRRGQTPVELQVSIDPDKADAAAPLGPGDTDFSDLLESICDELLMSIRYHQSMYPHHRIHRAIFMGGESRQCGLCHFVAKSLGLPSQLGDPIARLQLDDVRSTPGVDLRKPQPGWAVACGLCSLPSD